MRNFVIVTLVLLGLSACIPTVYPIYEKEDIVFRSDLVGAWSTEDGAEVWTFVSKGDTAYSLLHYSDGGGASFDANLVQLDSVLFMDLYPVESLKYNYLEMITKPSFHTFFKVSWEGKQLNLDSLDPDWLANYIENGGNGLDYMFLSDSTAVLTGQTPDLQTFLKTETVASSYLNLVQLQKLGE